jgi:hypothetical protein
VHVGDFSVRRKIGATCIAPAATTGADGKFIWRNQRRFLQGALVVERPSPCDGATAW